MSSALAVTFASFYMVNLDNSVLELSQFSPKIHWRYVDDIFVAVYNETELKSFRTQMECQSVLKFTYEIGIDYKLPFLDVEISSNKYLYVRTYTT